MLVLVLRQIHVQLFGQREQERARLQVWIRYVGRNERAVELREKRPAEERLAGAHLAGDLDEALAVLDGDHERVERFLMARTRVGEARVGCKTERQLLQTEM